MRTKVFPSLCHTSCTIRDSDRGCANRNDSSQAEREKAAVITKAEGEAMAAENLAKAAETMTSTPGALHLRTLSTLSDISADKSNTIVVALPIEVLEAIKGKDKDKK